jgi:hypothetical protein
MESMGGYRFILDEWNTSLTRSRRIVAYLRHALISLIKLPLSKHHPAHSLGHGATFLNAFLIEAGRGHFGLWSWFSPLAG